MQGHRVGIKLSEERKKTLPKPQLPDDIIQSVESWRHPELISPSTLIMSADTNSIGFILSYVNPDQTHQADICRNMGLRNPGMLSVCCDILLAAAA
jgi:hypothetical protein